MNLQEVIRSNPIHWLHIIIRDLSTVFEHIVLHLMNLIYVELYFDVMSLAQLKDSH